MPYARARIDETFSRRTVALLFAIPYCAPLLLYVLLTLILTGGGWVAVAAYACLIFPSGLAAPFITPHEQLANSELCVCTAAGYLIYVVLAVVAICFRQKWQVLSLLAVFMLLVGFNIGGCSRVSAAATAGISAP